MTQASYENKITGKREPNQPAETLGGILADDMGLGKTLTVLSTIIRTAGSAKEHAKPNMYGLGSLSSEIQDASQKFSRATLVVVPSPGTGLEPLLRDWEESLISIVLIDGWKKEIVTSVLDAVQFKLS